MIHAIIVPDEIKDEANLAAHESGVDPDGKLDTFCVPLIPIDDPDDATPTHWGCCGTISESSRMGLYQVREDFPTAMWWRIGDDGRLKGSHDTSDLGAFWSWKTCLEREGLKRRVDTPPPA